VIPVHDDNPTHLTPWVTWGLIAACASVFLWQSSADDSWFGAIIAGLGATPEVIFGREGAAEDPPWVAPWATVFTSMFLHGSVAHLLGNMLFLWVFGNNIEDAMGHGRFVLFYLVCGVVAVLAQALPDPSSAVPMVGASGAISGVLGAYLLLYPRARVLLALPPPLIFLTIGWVRAVWVLAAWFLGQVAAGWLLGLSGGGVALGAHIGGFVAGMLLVPLFKQPHVPLWRSH
jgi:membrane associated rhomboid family serine protease